MPQRRRTQTTLCNVHNALDRRQGLLVVAFHAAEGLDELELPRTLLLELLEAFPNAARNHQLRTIILSVTLCNSTYLNGSANQTVY